MAMDKENERERAEGNMDALCVRKRESRAF